MKRHLSNSHVNCPLCRESAAKAIANGTYTGSANIARRHNAALRRRGEHAAMRSLGLKKVRGALGGTYWE